jgi:hypothetical protein
VAVIDLRHTLLPKVSPALKYITTKGSLIQAASTEGAIALRKGALCPPLSEGYIALVGSLTEPTPTARKHPSEPLKGSTETKTPPSELQKGSTERGKNILGRTTSRSSVFLQHRFSPSFAPPPALLRS